MAISAGVTHLTHYTYDKPISLGPQDDPTASRAALPDQRPELFAQGDAGASFHQLAAGPVRQLAGAPRLPGEDARVQDRGRLRRRARRFQPVRLLHRALCRDVPVRLPGRAEGRARALSRGRAAGRGVRRLSRVAAEGAAADRRVPDRREQRPGAGDQVRGAHGGGGADPGGDADAPRRLLPRLRLAARPPRPPYRSRRALRLRLPDPARARHRPPSRDRRGRARTSPTCTPGPRSTSPAPAGWGSTPTSGLFCGEGHLPVCADAALSLVRADLGVG